MAEEEDPFSRFKLDSNPSHPLQNFVPSPQNFSTLSYQASQLREIQNPNPPVYIRVTEVKDGQPSGPPFGPHKYQAGGQLHYNAQNQWQAGGFQRENRSSQGQYQHPKPGYENPDWRANSEPRVFDSSKSLNPYINGSRLYRYTSDDRHSGTRAFCGRRTAYFRLFPSEIHSPSFHNTTPTLAKLEDENSTEREREREIFFSRCDFSTIRCPKMRFTGEGVFTTGAWG